MCGVCTCVYVRCVVVCMYMDGVCVWCVYIQGVEDTHALTCTLKVRGNLVESILSFHLFENSRIQSRSSLGTQDPVP